MLTLVYVSAIIIGVALFVLALLFEFANFCDYDDEDLYVSMIRLEFYSRPVQRIARFNVVLLYSFTIVLGYSLVKFIWEANTIMAFIFGLLLMCLIKFIWPTLCYMVMKLIELVIRFISWLW